MTEGKKLDDFLSNKNVSFCKNFKKKKYHNKYLRITL